MELSAVPQDLQPAFTQQIEVDGQMIPYHDHPFFKEAKDWNSFAMHALNAHREVGARIPVRIEKIRNLDGTFVPKAEGVADWRKNHLPKLYEAGILPKPIADVKEYGIAPSELMQKAGFPWSDEYAKSFGEILMKHGAPKEMAADLLKLHENVVVGANKAFKQSFDEGNAALQKEFGADYDAKHEAAKRLAPLIFKDQDDLDLANNLLGNHAGFLGIMMRLSHLAESDSSFMRDMTAGGAGGAMTLEQVRAEVMDIATNKNNPRHAGYMAGNKAERDYVDSLYAKIPGSNASVSLGEGITITPNPNTK